MKTPDDPEFGKVRAVKASEWKGGTKIQVTPPTPLPAPPVLSREQQIEMFLECPFCKEQPEVLWFDGNDYVVTFKGDPRVVPRGWIVQCNTIGCMFYRSDPDGNLVRLMKYWNYRGEGKV